MLSTNWNFASKSQNFIAMFHHNPGLTFNFWNFKIFPVLKVNSLCKIIFLIFFGKFPVFSLSGKSKNQIPCFSCFPCAVATLHVSQISSGCSFKSFVWFDLRQIYNLYGWFYFSMRSNTCLKEPTSKEQVPTSHAYTCVLISIRRHTRLYFVEQ